MEIGDVLGDEVFVVVVLSRGLHWGSVGVNEQSVCIQIFLLDLLLLTAVAPNRHMKRPCCRLHAICSCAILPPSGQQYCGIPPTILLAVCCCIIRGGVMGRLIGMVGGIMGVG